VPIPIIMKTSFTSSCSPTPVAVAQTAATAPQVAVKSDYLLEADKRLKAAYAAAAELLRTCTAHETYAGFIRLARDHKLTPAGLNAAVNNAYSALGKQGVVLAATAKQLDHALVSAEHVISGGTQAPLYQLFRDLTVMQTYQPSLLQRRY